MELGKQTLQEFVKREQKKLGGPLPESKCASIMKGICQALEYLHDEKNIIHRDLKPSNVLIGDEQDLSSVKLIDFGLACRDSVKPIEDFGRCGTLLYKPPEQINHMYTYSRKADMWAAGVMMYELIVGRHPFYDRGDTKRDIENKLKKFSGFTYPKRVSKYARHLIDNLCSLSLN